MIRAKKWHIRSIIIRPKSRDTEPDLPVPNAPWDSKTFYGDVGSQVTVNAVEIPGWVPTVQSQTITLDADSDRNRVVFRYGINAGLLIAGNGLDKDIYYSPTETQGSWLTIVEILPVIIPA